MKKHHTKYICLLATLSLFVFGCRKYQDFPASEQDPRLSGGSQTAFDAGSGAFDHSFTGLSEHDQLVHDIGDNLFGRAFVTAPAPVNQGLGPLYNNISCGSCHQSQGSGAPPTAGQPAGLVSFLLRISSGTDEHGGPGPVPGFGGQLQNNAVYGTQKEADYSVTYTTQNFTFPDGEVVALRAPSYNITNVYPGGSFSGVLVSPRLPPEVFGMGLLENIGDATILAMSNQAATDSTVIGGHPNYVWDVVKNQLVIGRFGHKAERPDLAQQIGIALNEDIGITNKIFPLENCSGQSQYKDDSLHPELSDSLFNALVYYLRTIQVPARRNVTDPTVLHGEQLFKQAKCSGCHRQTIVTDVNVTFPQVSNQTIHPYTDLLLHDLGAGLADGRPVYKASGYEFRTCPLWGIGLTQVVTGQTSFLHDGRATTLEQAILWHGGEAGYSKNFFVNLPKSDRDALIAFLNSL